MALTVSSEQRDALYELLLIRLSGIEAVWFAVRDGDFDAATRSGCEYSDSLRFILDDLGFGEGTGETIELRTPADVLRRVLKRLDRLAKEQRRGEEAKRAEAEKFEAHSELVERTCQQLLEALGPAYKRSRER